jgi:hypothetical protein
MLEARSWKLKGKDPIRSPSSFELSSSKHLQKPHNAGSRPHARFFNTLIKSVSG